MKAKLAGDAAACRSLAEAYPYGFTPPAAPPGVSARDSR